jgi:hypothetical protein
MNLKIRYNLWQAKNGLKPDDKFRADLWSKLDAKLHAEYNSRHSWFETRVFKFSAVAAGVVLLVICTGTGAYAYTSPDVTEGTILYPIKQNIENVEEKLQITPEAKAKFLLKKIQKREQEAVVMQKKGGKNLEAVENQISQTEDKLAKTEKVLEKIQSRDGKLRDEIKKRLENTAELRKQRLEQRSERLNQIRDRIESGVKNIDNNN